jgi:hypothetical protein
MWGSPGAHMLSSCEASLLTNFSVMAYSDGFKTVVYEIVVHKHITTSNTSRKINGAFVYRTL